MIRCDNCEYKFGTEEMELDYDYIAKEINYE